MSTGYLPAATNLRSRERFEMALLLQSVLMILAQVSEHTTALTARFI